MRFWHRNNENEKLALDARFFSLFMSCQKNIYAYILTLTHNYNDADDIMQETATIMWRNFEDFEPGTDFIAWGLTIARYQVMRFFKDRSRSRVQFNDDLLEQISQVASDNIGKLQERIQALKHCRKKLSPENRKLLRLRYQQGNTVKQIAEDSGKSVHILYKSFARIQQALQRCINKTLAQSEQEVSL